MMRLAAFAILVALAAPAAIAQQGGCGDRLGRFRVAELWDGDYLWLHSYERVGCSTTWNVRARCIQCNDGKGREASTTVTIERQGDNVTFLFSDCRIDGRFGYFIDAIFARHTCGCCGGSYASIESAGLVRP